VGCESCSRAHERSNPVVECSVRKVDDAADGTTHWLRVVLSRCHRSTGGHRGGGVVSCCVPGRGSSLPFAAIPMDLLGPHKPKESSDAPRKPSTASPTTDARSLGGTSQYDQRPATRRPWRRRISGWSTTQCFAHFFLLHCSAAAVRNGRQQAAQAP